MTRVLVVEDDLKIAHLLLDYLRNDGYQAHALHNGRDALEEIERSAPDVIILDLMLPGMDGLSVCRAVRRFSEVPILMLTARVDEVDRLLGLECGADDYVCKPFSPREVVARVRALVRRSAPKPSVANTLWFIDESGQRVSWRGKWLPLTSLEFRMLRVLLGSPGRIFSREQLLSAVRTDSLEINDRVIDSHIKNIRKKIDSIEPGFECIATVYGAGYRFDAPE